MNAYNLVSVIIPTHNGSNSVGSAIESVLVQDYENIEVIVVDDNGVGTLEQYKTEQVLKSYINNPKIHYILHETNKNGSAARNTGFKASSGEYICLLDDDDVYYPSKIRIQAEALNELRNDWGMVYCSVEVFTEEKLNSINKAAESGNILLKLLLHQVVIGSDSLMVRRSVFEELNGFDESFRRHQDFEFTARVAANYKIKALSFPGVRYNLTRRNSPKSNEIAIEYRRHYIEKMRPYIQCFNSDKQDFIICYNMIDFAGDLIKRGKIIQAYKKCDTISYPWINKYTPGLFVYVVSMKAIFKLKSLLRNLIFRLMKKQ